MRPPPNQPVPVRNDSGKIRTEELRPRGRALHSYHRGVLMALTAAQLDQQRKQAEELLFSGPQTLGFAKGLFFGHFNAPLLFPYPTLNRGQEDEAARAVAEVRRYADEHIDAAAIDRNAEIPAEVVAGLGKLGVLGMTAPKEYG